MPIFGLTNAPKAFMKLGQIRKGEMQTKKNKDTGKEYTAPVDLDHFRVTFQNGGHAEQIEAAFIAKYGKVPTELNVRFASPNIGDVWDAAYECYKQGGLIASCGTTSTGPYWIFYRDPDNSEVLVRNGSPVGERGREFFEKPIDLTDPIYKNSKGEGVFLEPVGRLQVVIPEVAHIAVGYFVFQPGSPRDIRNITAELGAYDAIARSYGKSITGIPFILRRRAEEVTVNIQGKLSKKLSWVVHLDAGGEWGQRVIETIERLALPDVIEAEYEDVEDGDPFEYPPEEEVKNEPKSVLALPAAIPEKPAPVNDPQIDPTSDPAVGYAAQQWDKSPDEAKKLIASNPKFTNPMSKKLFKKLVAGEV
jgi:hypothetical protein